MKGGRKHTDKAHISPDGRGISHSEVPGRECGRVISYGHAVQVESQTNHIYVYIYISVLTIQNQTQ